MIEHIIAYHIHERNHYRRLLFQMCDRRFEYDNAITRFLRLRVINHDAAIWSLRRWPELN